MASHLDLEEVGDSRTVRAAKRLADLIVPPLRSIVKRLPWVHSRIGETLSGRLGKVYSLLEQKQFADAFRLSQEGLARCEAPGRRGAFKEMPEFFWWHFFECYARGATGLGEDERAVVLARIARAPGPGGVLEAKCLDTFSRWRWAAGDADAAIEFARRAIAADPTWLYGHITLAWYGLVTGKFDPLPILREAVRVSPGALAEIRANADFARFPELIAALEGRG